MPSARKQQQRQPTEEQLACADGADAGPGRFPHNLLCQFLNGYFLLHVKKSYTLLKQLNLAR